MHIPDGFLDPKVSTSLLGVASVVLAYSLAKVREAVTALRPAEALAIAGRGMGNMVGGVKRALTGKGLRLLSQMGMIIALVFAAQLFDFQVGNGISGHFLGGALAGIILGPFAGTLAMAAVLIMQALFMGDGGLLALGTNIISMAVVGSLLAYYIFSFLKQLVPDWLAIMLTAWSAVQLAVLTYSLETFTFNPNMFHAHLVIGLAEALVTLALVKMFCSFLPE
jgi:cobalt/nickel transport system permease protein